MKSDIDISKIRDVNGGLLLVFVQLLEHGSVTRAARELSLGQSTISHSLSRLRELFQDPLFIRRPHGLEATQRALDLQPQIEELLNRTRIALGIGQSFNAEESQRMFRLSAPEFVTATVAHRLLQHLYQSAPSVAVRFVHSQEPLVFEALRRGELDVAVGRFEQAPDEIALQPLYQDEFCLACRRGHPITKGRMTRNKYRSVAHIWADSPTETIARDAEFDFSDYRGSVVPRWLTALVVAAQSDYVATCPRRLAESQAAVLNLQVLKLPLEQSIDIVLARRRQLHDRGVEWFVDQLTDVLR